MRNERIDLTQFEGMTKGPWRWDNDDYGAYVFTDNGEDGLQIASIESGEDNDASAIAKLPNLLAELKRCYERLDKANEAMLTAREVLMKHHEWMSVNDATSEEDDQEILDVVKDLREASE